MFNIGFYLCRCSQSDNPSVKVIRSSHAEPTGSRESARRSCLWNEWRSGEVHVKLFGTADFVAAREAKLGRSLFP